MLGSTTTFTQVTGGGTGKGSRTKQHCCFVPPVAKGAFDISTASTAGQWRTMFRSCSCKRFSSTIVATVITAANAASRVTAASAESRRLVQWWSNVSKPLVQEPEASMTMFTTRCQHPRLCASQMSMSGVSGRCHLIYKLSLSGF